MLGLAPSIDFCYQYNYILTVSRSSFSEKSMSSTSRSSKNSKEEVPTQYDQALDEVQNHIKGVFDILKRETNNLRQERKAFDEVAKKLEHVHFSKTLKLNVGGQLFSTSLETMKRDPGTCVFALPVTCMF